MARPVSNTEAGRRASEKWRATIEEKYGSLSAKMAEIGRMGGKASGAGGFASDKVGSDGLTGRERARIAGRKGGKIGKRGPSKKKELKLHAPENNPFKPSREEIEDYEESFSYDEMVDDALSWGR